MKAKINMTFEYELNPVTEVEGERIARGTVHRFEEGSTSKERLDILIKRLTDDPYRVMECCAVKLKFTGELIDEKN